MRPWLRRSVGQALALRPLAPSADRILLYHEVTSDGPPSLHVPPALFELQLEWIAAAGLSCRSVDRWRADGGRSVGISFDDGCPSAAWAAQRLIVRGWSCTLFVVPAWADRGRSDVLSWSALADLAAAGMEIGAHGWAHERLCGRDVSGMTDLLVRARTRIEDRLGLTVRGLAYPEGLASRAAREAARCAGFTYACTTEPGRNAAHEDPLALRRNEVLASDDRARAFLGKLAGSDDWMRPIRHFENELRCR